MGEAYSHTRSSFSKGRPAYPPQMIGPTGVLLGARPSCSGVADSQLSYAHNVLAQV